MAAFLGGCSVVEIPGRVHPVEISYGPGQPLAGAIDELLGATRGQILCFLPGAPEIRRAMAELEPRPARDGIEVVPLHGSLDAAAQDEAIRPSSHRRVILATNIAETSLTVPGVTAVVDTGLHKVARYDPARGIDSLETERITEDAADQRAGRAGRVAPGVARRLWDERDRLRAHREPEIHRVDLSGAILDILAWGGDPRALEWFEPPAPEALDAAIALLIRLGAVDGARLTEAGDRLGACRCIRGSGVSCWPPPARQKRRQPARCSRSATSSRRGPPRPRPICCRSSTSGRACRVTCGG